MSRISHKFSRPTFSSLRLPWKMSHRSEWEKATSVSLRFGDAATSPGRGICWSSGKANPSHPDKYIYICILYIYIIIYILYILLYIYDFAAKRWASGIELCNRPLREQLVALRKKNMSHTSVEKTSSPVALSLIFECSFMMLGSARRLLQFSKDQDVILKMCRGSHGKGLGEVSWMVQRLVDTQSIGIETISNLLGS